MTNKHGPPRASNWKDTFVRLGIVSIRTVKGCEEMMLLLLLDPLVLLLLICQKCSWSRNRPRRCVPSPKWTVAERKWYARGLTAFFDVSCPLSWLVTSSIFCSCYILREKAVIRLRGASLRNNVKRSSSTSTSSIIMVCVVTFCFLTTVIQVGNYAAL